MAARAYPTKWQCHECHAGLHLFATTIACTNVVDNGTQCAHKICDQCKSDKPIPSSLGIQVFGREHESQVLRTTPEDRAQIPLSNQSRPDMVSGPHFVKSDRDVDMYSLSSDSIPTGSFDVGIGEFPDVDLFGYPAIGVSDETILFKGKLDTGASACVIAESVASRFVTKRIDSNKWVTLDGLGQNGIRTIGQIRIVFRWRYGQKWYDAPFHVVPDSLVRWRFDTLLSDKLIKRMAFLALDPNLAKKHEGIHERSEDLDGEHTGVAAEREESDEETTSRDEEQEDLFGEYEILPVPGYRPSPISGQATTDQDTAEALSYLDGVKAQSINDDSNHYTRLLDIMKEFENQEIDRPGVMEQVSNLFNGDSAAIQNFKSFLAPGYRIESGTDDNPNTVRITTPSRTIIMTQSSQHRPHGLLDTTIGHESQDVFEGRPGRSQPHRPFSLDGVSTSFSAYVRDVLTVGNKGLKEGHERLNKEQEGWPKQNEGLEHENENKLSKATSTMVTEASEAMLNELKSWEESVYGSREASARLSASEPSRPMFPAVSADPKSPRDLDSDEESMAQSVLSANSDDTIISSTDFSEESEEGTAAQIFFQFIADDDSLRPLFEEAQEKSRLIANDFEATMRVLLKKFARELRSEAESEIQRKAVPFISQRAGFVARGLTRTYYRQDEASDSNLGQSNTGQTRLVANKHHLEDGEDEDEDEVSAALSEFHVLFSLVREFLSSSAAFAKLRETLRRLLNPEQPSWATIRDQWERELHFDFPVDLQQDYFTEILIEDKITWVDKFKSALEKYSGEEWLWEPFRAPRRPVPEGKVRLQWQCSCESIQWEDVSPSLAQKVQIIHRIEGRPASTPQAGVPSGQSSQAPTSVTCLSGSTITVAGQGFRPLTLNQGDVHIAGGLDTSTSQISTLAPSSQYSCRMLFVLLCVPYGWFGIPELKSSVIRIPESQDDDAFFREFRKHYRSLRGFMHSWFDLREFSFCHAARFEKWDLDSLGWSCDEMPPDQDIYEYVPQPAPKPYVGLLTRHEWRHRYNRPARTRGLRNAFQRMPKRTCPFQISTDASREYVWGLHAQLCLSVKMVLMWTTLIVFVITLGGWIFMMRWLSHHSGDLQNAAVPVTLVMMIWGLLCLPLSWVINKDT